MMIEDLASMADGRRRITAESFRLLTARLRAMPAAAVIIPDLIEALPAPEPFEPDPVPAEAAENFEADPVPAEEFVPEPEVIAPEPLAARPVETNSHADVVLPAFVPLWPLEAEESAAHSTVEAQPPLQEFSDESAVPESQAAPVALQDSLEAPDPPPRMEETEQPPAKPASHMVERIADALLQTVTEAIYAKPTSAERTAFLREITALVETDEGDAVPIVTDAPVEPAPATVSTIEPPAVLHEPQDIPGSLAGKLGPSAVLLLKQTGAPDPFSKTAKDAIRTKPVETQEADEDSGELALSLLDMMSAGAASGLPQERALAADTLLRMIPRVPVKQLIRVVERIAIMEAPPSLLVAKLIRDPRAEVVAPLLERCMHITDQDLMTAATEGDATKRRMIARRRILSPVLADHLIAIGDPSTILTLIRNPGAGFSHDAFFRLADHASEHHALLAPLTTRADLPAPVAFELFWFVPQELRRFIFSRFLTDSETLSKILKITLGAQEGSETKFPPRELLESVIDKAAAAAGKIEDAAQILADIGGVCQETALRILADPHGEPVTVILKALGYPRGKFADSMERFRHPDCQILRPDRNISELESLFDTLSFNKARILLTYWDWFVQKSGPYAPQH